jgi:hypothetical protein
VANIAQPEPRPDPTTPRSQPAFVVSCVLGAVGFLLIVSGLLIGGEVIFVVGAAAGAASLVAALYWRGELISAWRRDHPPATRTR